jgi:hypothetical protein
MMAIKRTVWIWISLRADLPAAISSKYYGSIKLTAPDLGLTLQVNK